MDREILEKPFPKEKIKSRKGHGRTLKYVEASEVIKRLNDAFGAVWSFKVVEYVKLDNDILVLGELSALETGLTITKQQFGSKPIVYFKGTKDPVDLPSDYKAAASDALKKCATHFGVALDLYSDEVGAGEQSTPDTGKAPPQTGKAPPASTDGSKRGDTQGAEGKRVQSNDEKAVWAIANKLQLNKFIVCKFNKVECDTDGKWKTAITADMWKKTRAMFKSLEDDVGWLVDNLQIEPDLTFEEVVAMVHASWNWAEFDRAVTAAKKSEQIDTLWTTVNQHRKAKEMPENGEM